MIITLNSYFEYFYEFEKEIIFIQSNNDIHKDKIINVNIIIEINDIHILIKKEKK